MLTKKLLFTTLLSGCTLVASAQASSDIKELDVQANKIGASVSSTMYGIFFEDINFAADGGLYAELVKNRSFEFPQHFMGWKTFGNVTLQKDGPFNRNPHYARLTYTGHRDKHTGLDNEGFFGIGLHKNAEYRFSVWARTAPNSSKSSIRVELINPASMAETQVLVSQKLDIVSGDWKKYEVVLKSPVDFAKAHLRIFLTSREGVDLEHVSLFPVDTWKGHKNGMRKDLAQALADLHPGVFRFPGGCIVEGTELKDRYQWKNTVGPTENRPLNSNRWEYTFTNRYYPDYFQSYGLGFFEYFQLAEEIGAAPLPILNVGLACEYQNAQDDKKAQVPLDSLDSYIQDALDLIEFANGGTDTKWGKLRADMGHPAPFNLKYLGIGNEQWGKIYVDRLAKFVTVLRKKHPEIQLVGSSGPSAGGKEFDYLWPEMRKLKVDLVDEHYYAPEKWFIGNAGRYDNYSRKGPKVFAGEYACHGANGKKWNHFEASLYEAAFMTGLERNADVVRMATYAPLFAHVEGWQWRPDLIWYDNTRSVRSCSYYVQQLYGMNKGTNVVPVKYENKNVIGQDGLYASAVWDKNNKEYIVKVVNIKSVPQTVKLNFNGLKGKGFTNGEVITYGSDKLLEDNTLDKPENIVPQTSTLQVSGKSLTKEIPAYTFVIYKLK